MFIKKFKTISSDTIEIEYNKLLKKIEEEYYLDVNVFEPIDGNEKFFNFLFEKSAEKKLNILDIGANVGKFSIYCSPVAKQVYAIEPSSLLCRELKSFISSFENISVHNCAISNKTGMIDFFYFSDCIGQSSIHPVYRANSQQSVNMKVQSYTIKDFILNYKIDFVDICKVDIEGEEVNIFNDSVLEELKPFVDRYWVEVHHTNHINKKNADQNLIDLINIFTKNNYKIYRQTNNWGFVAYM